MMKVAPETDSETPPSFVDIDEESLKQPSLFPISGGISLGGNVKVYESVFPQRNIGNSTPNEITRNLFSIERHLVTLRFKDNVLEKEYQ
ncbi:hypothetical protein HDU76_010804, partial [Blyttiomyces sp. JEL0837]